MNPNAFKLRKAAFNAAMKLADYQSTIDEIISLAANFKDSKEGLYFLLNVVAFLPDSYEIEIRRALADQIAK